MIQGTHIYGTLYGCRESLTDQAFLEGAVRQAVQAANATLVDLVSWAFPLKDGNSLTVGGVTVVAVLLESHIALHTWPEHGFVTADIYTCGETCSPRSAFDSLAQDLKASTTEMAELDRAANPEAQDG